MVNPCIACHDMIEYDLLSGKPQFHGPCIDLWLFQPWGDMELCTEHFQLEMYPWWRGNKLHNNCLLLWIIIKRQNTDVCSDISIFSFKMLKLKMFSIFWLRKNGDVIISCVSAHNFLAFPSEEENTLKAAGRWKHGLLCNLQLLQI